MKQWIVHIGKKWQGCFGRVYERGSFTLGISLLLLLAGTGCSENSPLAEQPALSNEVSFILRIPSPGIPGTRAMNGDKEYEVKEAIVLVFNNSSTSPTYAYSKTGTPPAMSSSGNNYTAEFRVQLNTGNDCMVAVVANPDADLKSTINSLTPGAQKQAVLKQLQYSCTGKWPADGSGNYTPIPMYGEVEQINITPGTPITGITLTRMLARIDVSVDLSTSQDNTTFELQQIYLCNYNTNGQIAPGTNAPNQPASPGTQTGYTNALAYTVTGATSTTATCAGEIYTFEAAAADESTDRTFYDSVCLVLEGSFNGESGNFYRVDFTYDGDPGGLGGTEGAYMPLLRNTRYQIEVTQVSGAGYRSLSGAIESYGGQSNGALKYRTVSYTAGEVADMVFDREYMLGSSAVNGLVTIPQSGQTNQKLIFYTDYPDGFVVESFTGESWITLAPSSNSSAGRVEYMFTVSQNTGATREATLILSAGRLRYTVVFRQ